MSSFASSYYYTWRCALHDSTKFVPYQYYHYCWQVRPVKSISGHDLLTEGAKSGLIQQSGQQI